MCSKCKFRQRYYEETGLRFNLIDDAREVAKELNLKIDNRPSGFYLVKYIGYICTNICSCNYGKFVSTKTICDLGKDLQGQLSFDINGNIQEV